MMMSLWNLLIPAARMRCYALLDNHGICRALRQSRSLPTQSGWVEVENIHPHWIGQALPAQAILRPRAATQRPSPALAA